MKGTNARGWCVIAAFVGLTVMAVSAAIGTVIGVIVGMTIGLTGCTIGLLSLWTELPPAPRLRKVERQPFVIEE